MSVQIIKNIINKEYCLELIDKIQSLLKDSDRRAHYKEFFGPNFVPKKFEDQNFSSDEFSIAHNDSEKRAIALLLNAMYLAKKNVENFYNVNIDFVEGGIVQINEGGYNRLHADQYRLDGSKWHDGEGKEDQYQFSAILYLSRRGIDFDGGQIYFPQHNVSVDPEPGVLVFFPGDLNHVHNVKKITSGSRHAIVMFLGHSAN
jgi:hypothetical protein